MGGTSFFSFIRDVQAQLAAAVILVTLPVQPIRAQGSGADREERSGGALRAAAAATATAGAWRAGAAQAEVANMAWGRDGGNPFAEPGASLTTPFR